ncbi:agmatine deiminase family protein [Longispora urticae]
MPAPWAHHEGCLMAWPTRPEMWGSVFARARAEYAAVATAISAFEPVTMIAAPGQSAGAREACGEDVDVIELPIDDSWLRDSGPVFVLGPDGERAGVDFRFNGWGGKFPPFDADDRISGVLLERLGVTAVHSPMVLEGGAITVDGEGTLITTEQCLLHPTRNPLLTRAQMEAELRAKLGVTTVIWLPYGRIEDTITDGHVDGVCVFVAPGTVLLRMPADPDHPDHDRMRANRAHLEASVDARGRRLRILELPQSAFVEVDGHRTELGYLNFYIANGGVVVPVAGLPSDEDALAVIAAALPDHKVVGVPATTIAYGGGGVHCVTQQIPEVTA